MHDTNSLLKYSVYIVVGLASLLLSLVLFLSIATRRVLRNRKEYMIIAGLCFADCVEATATFSAGVYRLTILALGLESNRISPLLCMCLPHANFWRWADITVSGMLLAVSFDRLFAVGRPLAYYTARSYSLWIIIVVYILGGIHWAAQLLHPIQIRDTNVSLFCGAHSIISPTALQISKYIGAFLSLMSVLLYVVVVVLLYCRLERISSVTNATVFQRQKQKQNRLTVTMGISCLCTLLLDTLPKTIGVYEYLAQDQLSFGTTTVSSTWSDTNWAQYFFLSQEINAALNFFLLTRRHGAIRHSVQSLLLCRPVVKKPSSQPNTNSDVNRDNQGRGIALKTRQSR